MRHAGMSRSRQRLGAAAPGMAVLCMMAAIIATAIALVAPTVASTVEVQKTAANSGVSSSLGVAGRQNANASMTALGPIVAAAWSVSSAGGPIEVFAAVSGDGGRVFSAPVRVNDVQSAASLSAEQPVRVALVARQGRAPALVVVWTAKGKQGTRLMSARSEDGGQSFGKPAVVPGTDAAGNRGWESVTVERGGRVVAMWLDHRALASSLAMADMHHDAAHPMPGATLDGTARAQLSKLYVAALDGGSAVQTITSGVCYCCKTAMTTGPDGAIYAVWRHVYPGNIRDIAFTVSHDNGRTFAPPVRVSVDQWMIDGCPEDGPAIAVDRANHVHVVWPTLVPALTKGDEPAMAIFHAVSVDGIHFSARTSLPTKDTPHHPQLVVAPDGNLIAAWDEGASGMRRVVWARGTTTGSTTRFARGGTMDSERAVYPTLAATASDVVLGWTGGPAEASHLGLRLIQAGPGR